MREKAGYSLRDLAVAAGVTTRTIQAIEAGGKGETSCAVIAALADALGVPRGWLAFGG
jgi:transcriptional regulator with XRE-family HTH domain